jgi:hypothetical protein
MNKISSINKIILGAGGGFDIFGALPKILEIIKTNAKPNIVIISNNFAHTGYAKMARDSYKTNCEKNPENITLLNTDTLIKFITGKCYKIIDFTKDTPDLNTYHPEGLMFKLLRDLKKTNDFTFEIYSIFGWISYPKNEVSNSNITEPATFNETHFAIETIIKPLVTSDYEILIQDCGCDILPNEKTLLNTNLKYGMGSQYEEMKVVAAIYLLVNNLILDPMKIKFRVINLGGDLAGRYTNHFLTLFSKNINIWLNDPYVEENFKLLNGTSADSFANICMKACYDKHTIEIPSTNILSSILSSVKSFYYKYDVGEINYNQKISDYQQKIDAGTKQLFVDGVEQNIIKDTMFMLESYPANPSIDRILSVNKEDNRQKVLTLPLTIQNQLTELIIDWSDYSPPDYIKSFDEIKDLNFEQYHRWIDNYYKQLLMQNMSDEMKEIVKDLHYNYRWSAWSSSINDIYDFTKGAYINYDFASDQFKKTENIWTWSMIDNAWTNLNNCVIKLVK